MPFKSASTKRWCSCSKNYPTKMFIIICLTLLLIFKFFSNIKTKAESERMDASFSSSVGEQEKEKNEDIFVKRRRHVEEYCRLHETEQNKMHDDFVKSLPNLLRSTSCCLHFNRIANLLFCVPEKAGSTESTSAIYSATITQLGNKIPTDCTTANPQKINSRGNGEHCITEQINVRVNSTTYDQAAKLTDSKFMFYRHPMARLVSSYHHGQAVSKE